MQVYVSRDIAELSLCQEQKDSCVYRHSKNAELVKLASIHKGRGNHKLGDLTRFSNNALASTTNGAAVRVYHVTALQYAADCTTMTC